MRCEIAADHSLVSACCTFPPAEDIKSLLHEHCLVIKIFIKEIWDAPYSRHKAYWNDLVFEYSPLLPNARSINSQKDFAEDRARYFFDNPLLNTLDKAAKQLGASQYNNFQKFLFVGIQLDSLFLIDWTDEVLHEKKLLFAIKAYYKYGIVVIFSEDVGFSFARYL